METSQQGNNYLCDMLDTPLRTKIQNATKAIPRRSQWRLYLLCLLISDILMIGLGFRIAYLLRFDVLRSLFNDNLRGNIGYYQNLVFLVIPVWLVIFVAIGLYDRQKLLGGTREYALVFNGTTIGMMLLITAVFLDPDFTFARGWLIFAWAMVFFSTAFGRFILRRWVFALRERGYYLSLAVMIGANNEGISLAEQLMHWKTSGFYILGFIDKKLPAGSAIKKNLYVLGTVEDLDGLIDKYGIEEVILASSAISSRDKILEIFQRYLANKKVNVRMSSGLYEILTTGLTVQEFAYVPLVGVNKVRLTGFDEVMKFLLDYLITIPVLVILSPIIIALAIAVKFDSPGPVIHRHRVMGVNGRQFDAYKFRTMHVREDRFLEKNPYVPSVTRVGRLLRRYGLDELPQLFNVLRREISLVGPRIITPAEVGKYEKLDINLMTVRPGLTGLWQVSGRSDISYKQRVRLDMNYIRNWSIWLDIQILLQTIPVVLQGRGDY